MLTRPLDAGPGPHGNTPGAPPPFHVLENVQDTTGQMHVSRLAGQDDTLNPEGWVGVSQWNGQPAYAGRDPYDPSTWQYPGDELAEPPTGMFARLHQEAAGNG